MYLNCKYIHRCNWVTRSKERFGVDNGKYVEICVCCEDGEMTGMRHLRSSYFVQLRQWVNG